MATQHHRKPWEDVLIPDEMRSEASYPVVQWINQPFRLRPPQENGGFFVARKYGGVELPGGVEAQYHDDPGTFATNLTACLLAIRVAWVKQEAGAEIRLSGYEDGARKRVECLMLLRDEATGHVVGPVKLTTVGTANKELTVNYRALASTAKAAGAEPWMFWVGLRAGETRQVGDHGVTMTPIAVDVPEADALDGAFVGKDVLENAIFPLSDDLAEWRDAWNGDDIGEDVFEEDFDDGVGTPGMTYEEALQVRVHTKAGWKAFGAIIQDTERARQIVDYILDPASSLTEEITAAAQVIHDEHFAEDTEDTEEIPF
jgi:hypothetical protein